MSYEKDKLDTYVTSASLSTALAPYVTSDSLSAAIAGLDLAPYVTSNSLSAAVATDALTVRGAASVSATMSAAAVTVGGHPVGAVLLGVDSGTAKRSFRFSGSWSDFAILQLHAGIRNGSGVFPLSIYTDGGTTPILTGNLSITTGAGTSVVYECRVFGGDGAASKIMSAIGRGTGGVTPYVTTTTANAGFVNCISVSISLTASLAFAALYGWRKA